MSIVDRSFQFISMAVQAVIFVVIALMVLRLIANAADLNPFAWTSRTIHRLTDVFVLPMRRSLLRLGFDPKYAPLGVILVTIILGLFSLQLASLLAVTVHGVVVGILEGRPGQLFEPYHALCSECDRALIGSDAKYYSAIRAF